MEDLLRTQEMAFAGSKYQIFPGEDAPDPPTDPDALVRI